MVCFLSMMRRFYSLAFITALFAGTLPFGYASPAEDDLTRAAADELTAQAELLREEARKRPAPVEAVPQIDVEKSPEPEEALAGPSFYVSTIYLQGNTVVPEKTFQRFAEPFRNRRTDFAELKAFTEIITNHYRSLGYVTSRAYLPPQTIEDET